jgi:hypothetical protein
VTRGVRIAAGVLLGALALAGGGLLWLSWSYRPVYDREDPVRLRAEVAALTVTRDSVRDLVFAAAEASPLLQQRPDADLMVALPAAFVEALVRDIITGWFHEVELHLRNLRVAKAGEVRARIGILGRRRVGTYDLRLRLDDVRGRLEPGAPTLRFTGDRIGMVVPVRLASGSGTGVIAFEWDSRGMANAVCGDLAAERRIEGTVRPQEYVARGRLTVQATDSAVLIDPAFPDLAIRLRVVPSARSVRMLEELLATKGGLCGIAIGRANVEQRILDLVDRGFTVKVPQRFFRPVQLPIAIESDLTLPDRAVRLSVTPAAARITPLAVWLGANVAIERLVGEERPVANPPSTRP